MIRIGATHSPPRFGGYNIGYKQERRNGGPQSGSDANKRDVIFYPLLCKQGVTGSIPVTSTNLFIELR